MNESKNVKALKKQLAAAIAMVCVAAVALGSSTYAWFVSNTRVQAKTATMTSKTAYTLLISEGAKASDGSSNWGTVHDWTDGKTSKQLSPVSTIGKLNSTNGLDFVYDKAWKSANADGDGITKGGNYANTFDVADSTKYIKESFEIKAAQDCQLILDKDTAISGTEGELDRVLRLALVVDDDTTQKVFMYQVNPEAGTATQINTTADSTNASADGIKNAINPDTKNVAAIDTSVNLENSNVISLADGKNAGSGSDTIMTYQGTGKSVLYNFDITKKDTVTVTAYIWMEGCDYDCNALETQNFKNASGAIPVTATLSFSAAAAQ